MENLPLTERDAPGANNPPISAVLLEKHADLFTKAQALIAAKDRLPDNIPIEDPEDADGKTILGRVSAMVVALRNHEKLMDNTRDAEKKPFDLQAKEVQQLFKGPQDQLLAIKRRCEGLIGQRNVAMEAIERERRLRLAEAERLAMQQRLEDAAKIEAMGHGQVAAQIMKGAQQSEQLADRMDRQAGGGAADLVRTNTEAGTVSSVKTFSAEITDQAALRATLGALGDHFTVPELDKAIRSFMVAERKAGRPPILAGVTFSEGSRASVRG